MILKAEATIDIDDKRRIWIELSAKPNAQEDPSTVVCALAESLTESLLEAYHRVVPATTPGEARTQLMTFGDDDE